MKMRWKRAALVLAGGLAGYTVVGFWALPALVKQQLPALGQSVLERQLSVGAVQFNPYTLRLQADDLRLAEADGRPLFAVGQLQVELQWRSLLRRAWSFAEIRIGAPNAQLSIAADGSFNLAELLATLDKRPHDPPEPGLPRLVIERFVLEQGRLAWQDRQAGYADVVAPLELKLEHLSTLPEQNGSYAFSADVAGGGKLSWHGDSTLSPIAGSGVLTLERLALPGLASYLKAFSYARVDSGKLSASLPYRFSYADGKLGASLEGASLSLQELALSRAGAPFAALKLFELSKLDADLGRHAVTLGALRLQDGLLTVRRDAKGELNLASLMVPARPAPVSASASTSVSAPAPAKPAGPGWKFQLRQLALDKIGVNYLDDTVNPAFRASAEQLQLALRLDGEQAADGLRLTVGDAGFTVSGLSIGNGAQTPLKLAKLGFTDGSVDLAGRHASVGRLFAEGGQFELLRDARGQLPLLAMLPKAGKQAAPAAASTPAGAAAPWSFVAKRVELRQFDARLADQGTGIRSNVRDFSLSLDEAGSDLGKPLAFQLGFGLREGGQLSAQGKLTPASGALDTELAIKQVALAPLQPLLSQHLKLRIAGGNISARGRLKLGAGAAKQPAVRYAGDFELAGLALDEDDGDRFLSWKNVRADRLTATVGPNLLDVPDLRIVEPVAKLMIENDRSFNAQRLLVRPAVTVTAAASAPTAAAPAVATTADAGFPLRVRRVRLQNAKLDFTDLSLRPQFSAKIYELGGVITGLSSRRDARSQIELDGRVDEFGLARVRGQLNPFAPSDNTDLNVVFKNVDMVAASPYSMKFAGYKIAEGKISLDLQYKVRHAQLEGNNQIVLDKLTLGERIDSPDALKLPLELALAILKDQDGRIDLGLPVTGNLNDPQFSYGAVVWKAIGNVLSKVAMAPFRALGSLFGFSGDKLEALDFDAGSASLLPPEREKIRQVAQILSKRAQLKLEVPGQYSEAADGAALRAAAVRAAVARRAGIVVAAGEQAGPINLGERSVRGALRGLYGERFGAAALDQQKKAAEAAAVTSVQPAGAAGEAGAGAAKALPVWQRLGKLVQGEPQVADPSAFYNGLRERLEQSEKLAPDTLEQLGKRRAAAILAALQEAGVAAGSVRTGAPEPVDSAAGKPVALKLGLSGK